jgi:serine phosphatase RsbU (regulator of sigma subunit)
LRLRLLGLVVLVLVPCLGLVLYTTADERRNAVANVETDAMRLIRIVSSTQAAQIEGARQLLTAFARMPQLRDGDRAQCNRLLAELLPAYPLYLNFALAEPDGTMTCSARTLPETSVNVADRSYFRRAFEVRGFVVGDYQVGRVTGLPAINYAYPVLDDAGNVRAVAFAAQSLAWLTRVLAELELPKGADMIVVDRNGTVLARIPDVAPIGTRFGETRVLDAFAGQARGGVFQATDANGDARLWSHAPLLSDGSLRVAIGVPEAVALADVNRRLARNLAALALVTLVALGAAWFGSKLFILRPVRALVAATAKLASGKLDTRVPLQDVRGELGFLARAVNAMAATLEKRDRELRVAEECRRTAEIELAVGRAHMEIARQIQRSMLPEDPLRVGSVELAGRCIPAADVGGDYFGYFPRGRTGIDTFLGDVSGHGVGAALLMAEARTTFMAERLGVEGAGAILRKLNRLLFDDLDHAGHFMSACCATFDSATRELRYANAGHPPAILVRAGETPWRLLNADGKLLGMQSDVDFGELRLALHGGDIVTFYTDGLTEARNRDGEFFGVPRLADLLAAHREREPETLVSLVLADVQRFAGTERFEDDVTIVAMKVA